MKKLILCFIVSASLVACSTPTATTETATATVKSDTLDKAAVAEKLKGMEAAWNLSALEADHGVKVVSEILADDFHQFNAKGEIQNRDQVLKAAAEPTETTTEVINGDIHQRNADVLGVSRKIAKPFLYAYLFGAGAGKLGLILTGKRDTKVGQQADEKFKSSIPGLAALKDKLSAQYNSTANRFGSDNAYIRGLDGRLIFVSSEHQTLNYLLQTAEGITCKAAMVYARDRIKAEKILAYPIIHYHDEMAWVCKDEDAEVVREICVEAFKEAPKLYGVTIMDGEGKIGQNWYDVH